MGIATEKTETLDTCELTPMFATFKITSKMIEMKRGEILEVIGKHKYFETDMKNICIKMQKRYTFLPEDNNGYVKCFIYI
jgi:TusA-related sulfurtransferase